MFFLFLNFLFTTLSKLHYDLIENEFIRSSISYSNIFINVDIICFDVHLSNNIIVFHNSNIFFNFNNRCLIRIQCFQNVEIRNVDSQTINAKNLNYEIKMKFCHDVTCISTKFYLRRKNDFVSIKYTFDESK